MQTQILLIADAGPLIVLAKCDQLALLVKLFGGVHVPQAVVQETLQGGDWPEIPALRAFLQAHATVHLPDNGNMANSAAQISRLRSLLHEGEAQAIALASKLQGQILMDELRGRQVAKYEGVAVIGTLGLLLRAKQLGHLQTLAPLIHQIRASGYGLSQALVDQVLILADEQSQ